MNVGVSVPVRSPGNLTQQTHPQCLLAESGLSPVSTEYCLEDIRARISVDLQLFGAVACPEYKWGSLLVLYFPASYLRGNHFVDVSETRCPELYFHSPPQ